MGCAIFGAVDDERFTGAIEGINRLELISIAKMCVLTSCFMLCAGIIRNTGCFRWFVFSVSFHVGASDMVVMVMPLVTVMLNVVMASLGVVVSKKLKIVVATLE